MGESPVASAEPADAELLARHAAGDPNAFAEIVRRHRDRLWRVSLRTLGNPEDAADALQDALLSAYRAAAGYRGEAAVTTWLHRIVVNACLDLARRRAARPTSPLADSPAADQPAPDVLGERETATEILRALRELPAEQAAAIVLVDVEGYPVAIVAEMLEVPAGTVKSRCARGRARLAERLQHLGSGNPSPSLPVQPDERGDTPPAPPAAPQPESPPHPDSPPQPESREGT
jgi:RNA polymerase sigma-70 factor (ECF subfamily)